MPRIKSQIIEDYAKILEDAGLLKQAYSSLKEYEDDPEARAGSDTVDTIEALYGVKPDSIESMEYENNIMEAAHPKSVIIAPSYDKINGLVENNIERNNIMTNITLTPPTGNHTNRKYAHQELVLELVRIANEMDTKNKENLFKLADECIVGLHKEAISWDEFTNWLTHKQHDVAGVGEGVAAGAGIGAAIGALLTIWSGPGATVGATMGALGGAALSGAIAGGLGGGIISSFTKTAPQVKNVEENAHEVLNQLSDLEKKVPEQKVIFDAIKSALINLTNSTNEYQSVINKLHLATNASSPVESPVEPEEVKKITNDFVKNINEIKKIRSEFNRLAQSGAFAKAKPSSTLSPIYWFIQDDIEDVDSAFEALEEAIDNLQDANKQAIDNTHQVVNEHKSNKASENSEIPKDLKDGGFDVFRSMIGK